MGKKNKKYIESGDVMQVVFHMKLLHILTSNPFIFIELFD